MNEETGMNDVIIQKPDRVSYELILLFHGVGSSPEDLQPLGMNLAAQHPDAWVISVRSPDSSDFGRGWQWFSVQNITETNRPARIDATMSRFLNAIAHWQQKSAVSAAATTLVGFSQGAIMALEATQRDTEPAGRVVAIAGRFAVPPRIAAPGVKIHLLHGELDSVVPTSFGMEAATQLRALRADVSLDLFPGLNHGIDGRMVQRIHERLIGQA